MLVTLLLAYSLGISFYLIGRQRRQQTDNELERLWQTITSKPNPSTKEIKAIAEIAKARQTEIPWYERSLSTIGIVAFFSMLIATSFQTINSAKTEIESSNLKQEIKGLESQRASWKQLIKGLSEVIVLKQTNGLTIEESEANVLKQRLDEIDRIGTSNREDDVEKLRLFIALKQYDSASALVEKSAFLKDEASPEIVLLVAEGCYLDGAKGRARSLLKKVEPELSKQRLEWQLRFLVLNAVLASDYQPYVNQVAALKRVSLGEAEEWLKAKVDQWKDEARKRSMSVPDEQGNSSSGGR